MNDRPPRPAPEAPIQGTKILLCVTGGIAAYKVAELTRMLALAGADVRVVMTAAATQFVGTETFAALSGNPVSTELFAGGPDAPHVELARVARLAIVAPAGANTLARMAAGLADDLLSATLLTATCPVLVAPAMHTQMWEHPATAANVRALRARGVIFCGPATGALSSGDEGAGRMVEPQEIASVAAHILGRAHDLAGRRVLVTAGATREPIDPVRFLGNRSSGQMGVAVAQEALERGAKVTVIAAHCSVAIPPSADVVGVETAEEMRAAVLAAAPSCDVIVKAAAVADFAPRHMQAAKLKKEDGPPEITLQPTPDILAELGRQPELRAPDGLIVGFAAETTGDAAELAKLGASKRASKGADIIVANQVGAEDSGFDSDRIRAVIVSSSGTSDIGLVPKRRAAAVVIDEVVRLLARRRP